jgi:hypothetical protein
LWHAPHVFAAEQLGGRLRGHLVDRPRDLSVTLGD